MCVVNKDNRNGYFIKRRHNVIIVSIFLITKCLERADDFQALKLMNLRWLNV